jgi:chemotaxis protein methyltransferase CheR
MPNVINQSTASIFLHELRRLIHQRTGLALPEGGPSHGKLLAAVERRMRFNRLSNGGDYFRLLERQAVDVSDEWDNLIAELTVSETYFFRDKGQFELLEHMILPKLIRANRVTRTLRLWSAGCASGEEVYSLAILLDRLLPDNEHWDVQVLGIDIDQQSIDKARRGRFRQWSFRGMDAGRWPAYFKQVGQEWDVAPTIRNMVLFQKGNLISDSFPAFNSWLRDVDLIVCRNVFIYFDKETVAQILPKLTRCLKEGGYLVAGHSELYGQKLRGLRAVVYPESIIYQRDLAAEGNGKLHRPNPPVPMPQLRSSPITTARRPPVRPRIAPVARPGPADSHSNDICQLEKARALFGAGAFKAAADAAAAICERNPHHFDACYLLARGLANLGRYEEAEQAAREAIKANTLAHEPYYLLAHIEEARGESEAAKKLLDQVLYLQPDLIPAYLDLAAILERSGNGGRSGRLRQTALKLLERQPPDQTIEPYDSMTALELKTYIESLLSDAETRVERGEGK